MSGRNLLVVKPSENTSDKIFIMAVAACELPRADGLRRLAVLRNGRPVPERRPDGVVVFLKTEAGRRPVKVHDPDHRINLDNPNVVFKAPGE